MSSHVLYVKQNDDSSEIASYFCQAIPSILVQDISDLIQEGVEIPPWLAGYPTLVDIKELQSGDTTHINTGGEAIKTLWKFFKQINQSNESHVDQGYNNSNNYQHMNQETIQSQEIPKIQEVQEFRDSEPLHSQATSTKSRDSSHNDTDNAYTPGGNAMNVSTDDAFAPLVSESDSQCTGEGGDGKVDIEDVNAQLALRGIGAGEVAP